jgi:hypothetical protein
MKRGEDKPDLGALLLEVVYDDQGHDHIDTLKCPVHKIGDMWYFFEFRKGPYYHF